MCIRDRKNDNAVPTVPIISDGILSCLCFLLAVRAAFACFSDDLTHAVLHASNKFIVLSVQSLGKTASFAKTDSLALVSTQDLC